MTRDAINERNSLFQFLVEDNEIDHLYNLKPILQLNQNDLPVYLACLCGDNRCWLHGHYHVNFDRYLNLDSGASENKTFDIPFSYINDALPDGIELTGDQFVDYFIDMLNVVPPRKVNGIDFDWDRHFRKYLKADQQGSWEDAKINVLKCKLVDVILAKQTSVKVLIYDGRIPGKHLPQQYKKAHQQAIELCACRLELGLKTSSSHLDSPVSHISPKSSKVPPIMTS